MVDKLRVVLGLIFKKSEQGIYRRILRTALLGSLLTFLTIGTISLCSMLLLQTVLKEKGTALSEEVGTYLENTLESETRHHLTETTLLKARVVSNIFHVCSLNIEFMADKMSNIMLHPSDHVSKNLPVANDMKIPSHTPYVYYTPNLIQQGISDKLRQEISYASSIDDEMTQINRYYFDCVIVASKHGYMIRMDMLGGDIGAVLDDEPLRSTYDYMDKDWYRYTEKENKLIFTNPYLASYGQPCISVCAPYYDADGFAGVVEANIDTGFIYERMKETTDDASEFSFIMGRNGEVLISHQKDGLFAAGDMNVDLRQSDNRKLADAVKSMVAGETGITTITTDGKSYYLAYAPLPDTDWSIGTIIDKSALMENAKNIEEYTLDAIHDRNKGMQKLILAALFMSAMLFVLLLWPILKANIRMAKGIAAPIDSLAKGALEIARGNLSKRFSIQTGDEIETLAKSFNYMTEELALQMENLARTTAQNERIETELAVATNIQTGMLPNGIKPFPERKDFDLAALMYPAREVGGDFYDFYLLNEHLLAITVADVSNKGVPAALFMVIAKTLLQENLIYAGDHKKLGTVFGKTNDSLEKSNDADMFVTVFTGILNTDTGEFLYANAGHNPPIIMHGGKCRYLEKADNPIMGIIEGLSFQTSMLQLSPGDRLFLYTDGITEARNMSRDFLGERRFLDIAQTKIATDSAEAGVKAVHEAVKEFVGDAVQSDDITMLELVYNGPVNERSI